jgi:carbon-monoxide dehydrogenase small subunit
MLLAAADLVERNPGASRAQIREHMSGNFCRCTGYHSIVDAVEAVCRARTGDARGRT